MVFPNKIFADEYRRERNEQTLKCARAYDESMSLSAFKIRVAAEGIKHKDIVRKFYIHYLLHNNRYGAVEYCYLYALLLSIAAGIVSWIAVSGIYLIAEYIINGKFSISYVFLVCSFIVIGVFSTCIQNVINDFMEQCCKFVDDAIFRYKRELFK